MTQNKLLDLFYTLTFAILSLIIYIILIYPISWMVINIGMVIAYNRVSGRMIKT